MKAIVLKPHQKEASGAVVRDLRSRQQALLVMATGLGKTITAGHAAHAFCGERGRILFLVHNNGILRQAPKDFCRFFPGRTTTFINGEEKGLRGNIVFATFQSLSRMLDHVRSNAFNLVVVDEGHHAEADEWAPVVEHFSAPRLCLTATPDRLDGKDIRRLFGNESYSLGLPEALARGLLPRVTYRFVADSGFSKEELQRIVREVQDEGRCDVTIADLNRRLFVLPRDEEIVAILERNPCQRAVFCRTIAHAERMAELLPMARAYHSAYTNARNGETLDLFQRRALRYLTVVDAFNEGITVPSVQGAAFLRTTESKRIYYQQLGRLLHSGGDEVEVLDFAGSVERIEMARELHGEVTTFFRREGGTTSREPRDSTPVHATEYAVFEFDEEIADLLEVVARIEEPFYTYEEAQMAVRRLGITKQLQYDAEYRRDKRLPSSPRKVYPTQWKGWPAFFGRRSKRYRSPEGPYKKGYEARRAVMKLGFKNAEEYRRRYKEDPRLPADPNKAYPTAQMSWNWILGKKIKKK